MTILDKYVIKQCFTSFLFFTIVLSLVAWINEAIELVESLARDGHSVATVVDLIALSISKILVRVFPISAFAATVFTIIRLSNESELTVMLAAGLRPRQIAKPYFIFGLITTLFALSMSIYLAPLAEKLLSEKKFELSQAYTSKFLNDVFTYDYSASKAYLLASENKAIFVLTNGVIQIHNTDQKLLSLTNFDELTYDLSEAFAKNKEPQIRLGELPTYLLWSDPIAAMNAADKTLAQVLENFHSRIQRALLCLVATLIGFATLYAADFSRYGRGRFVALAIFLLANVKIVESAVIAITRSNSSSWPLVYLPTLIGLSIVVIMIMFSEHKWKLKND